MKFRFNLLAAAFLSLFVFCPMAFAQTYTVGFDSNQYDIDINESVDVRVLLFEDVSGGGTSRLEAGMDDGLFTFSLGIDFSAFAGGATGASYNSLMLNDLFTTGFAGSGDDVTVGTGIVSFEGTEDFAGNDTDGEDGVGGVLVGADLWAVELATVTFDAGSDATTTTLQAGPHANPNGNAFLFADGSQPTIGFSAAEIVVGTAIPEPATASILGLLFVGVAVRRRK